MTFLVLNNIPPPQHWALNISQSDPASDSTSDPLAWVEWTAWDWLMTSGPGLFGLVAGLANPTGIVLLIILGIMFVCSMKWVRKSGNFEVDIAFQRRSERQINPQHFRCFIGLTFST